MCNFELGTYLISPTYPLESGDYGSAMWLNRYLIVHIGRWELKISMFRVVQSYDRQPVTCFERAKSRSTMDATTTFCENNNFRRNSTLSQCAKVTLDYHSNGFDSPLNLSASTMVFADGKDVVLMISNSLLPYL